MSPSFGHTSADRAKTAALLSLLGLLLTMFPLHSGLMPASAASNPTATGRPLAGTSLASVPFMLGFSPSTLSPVANGVPVYTVGDTIWAESGYNYSLPLAVTSARAPGSASSYVPAVKLLDPGIISPLYTFSAKDTDGVWNITLVGLKGGVVIPVHFVNLADHPVSLGPLAYALDGGNLSISTQANLGDSYDQQVCAAGNATSAGISLSLPADMRDTGNLRLTAGNPAGIATSGQVNESFSFWFELYHPYALDISTANSLVVNDLMTAASQPVAIVSAGTTGAPLTLNMPLNDGRYELRAYFQNSTSLDVVQRSVLVVNESSWVSLSDQCQPQAIQSTSVSYSASLTNGQDNWPRSLYVMYRAFGIEAVASYHVKANLSSVDFVAIPWNQTLQDVKVNVTPAAGILQTSQVGSSLFVLASQYPVRLDYSLDISGGHSLASGSVVMEGSYATQTSKLTLAKLTVHVLSDQTAPTTLDVTGPQGVNITTGLVGNNQTSSFLLPTGSYTVMASQAGNSQTAQVGLADGVASSVTLNFNTFLSFEIILVVTAVLAAIANVLILILRSRSLSSRMASPSKAS